MDRYINKVLDLYSKTKIDDPAKGEFHNWLISNNSHSEKERGLLDIWNATDNASAKDFYFSCASIETKMHDRSNKRLQTQLHRWRSVAAVAAIVLIASVFLFANRASSQPNYIEHFCQSEEPLSITLPDGSTVLANKNTVILYSDAYGQDTRTIYLSGEANFKVQKDADVPFIVKSNGFSVTALGTEFNVSSYPDSPNFKTTLISGSVKVNQNNNANQSDYILTANQQFVCNKLTGECTTSQADLYESMAWMHGDLVLRGLTMKEVLDAIEQKYAVSFQYKSNIFNDDKYNFTFKNGSLLPDVMDIIREVNKDFEYQVTNDQSYYIRNKK